MKEEQILVSFFKDGDKWQATYGDFVDMMQSSYGFGKTAVEAFANLVVEEDRFGEGGLF